MRFWTTESFSKDDRYDAWEEEISSTHLPFGLTSMSGTSRIKYKARTNSTILGGLGLVSTNCAPCRGLRTAKEIRRTQAGYYGLLCHLDGVEAAICGNKSYLMTGKQMVLWDSEYNSEFRVLDRNSSTINLMIPKDSIDLYTEGRRIDPSMAETSNGLSALFISTLRQVMESYEDVVGQNQEDIESLLLNMVSKIFLPTDNKTPISHRQELLKRANAFIRENIANPDLNAGSVATHLGISIRYMHQLYTEQNQSCAETIRLYRLSLIYNKLLNHDYNDLTLSQIAYSHGFNNMSHFSRLFKRKYGFSPSQARSIGASTA